MEIMQNKQYTGSHSGETWTRGLSPLPVLNTIIGIIKK